MNFKYFGMLCLDCYLFLLFSGVLWPHHRCTHQPSLVAVIRLHMVQAGCSGIQGATWRHAILPWSTRPCHWFPWSTSAAFCCCATSQTVYSRQSSLPGRCCPTLEQLAWWHRAVWFAVDLSTPTDTSSVAAVLPRCCTVPVAQLCYCDTLDGPSSGSSYLGHYKNYWLIDWSIVHCVRHKGRLYERDSNCHSTKHLSSVTQFPYSVSFYITDN